MGDKPVAGGGLSASLWRHRPKILPYAVLLIVSFGLSFAYLGKGLWTAPKTSWRGNPGDPEQFMWFLRWIPYAIRHGHNPFLTNYALYPEGANMMWNGSIIVPAILISPVTLTVGPVVAFQVLLVLAPVGNTLAAYALFGRWVKSPVAAGVGALAFGFCPLVTIHSAGHIHLTMLALLPLIFLMLDEIFIRQRWRPWIPGVLLGFLTSCQLLTGEEMLAIAALMAGCALVLAAAFHFREMPARIPYILRAAWPAILVAGWLSAYPLWVQLKGPRQAPGAHLTDVYVIDLYNFVQPVLAAFGVSPSHNQGLPYTGNAGEWTGYIGIPLIVAMVIAAGWQWKRRPVVPVAVILAVFFAVLSLGPFLHVNGHDTKFGLPWGTFERLPLMHNLLASRLSVAVSFFAAILLAVFVDALITLRHRLVQGLGAALVILVGLSLVPSGLNVTHIKSPAFFRGDAVKTAIPNGSVTLIVPYVYGPTTEHPMLWQAEADMHFRMIDGWLIVPGFHFGTNHIIAQTLKTIGETPVAVTAKLRSEFIGELRARKVENVLVAPMAGRPNAVTFFTALFGHGPDVTTGGVDVWRVPAAR
ncbi:MAG: hypothetical protein ACR2F6_05155 [Mycobacteriales bacterium]